MLALALVPHRAEPPPLTTEPQTTRGARRATRASEGGPGAGAPRSSPAPPQPEPLRSAQGECRADRCVVCSALASKQGLRSWLCKPTQG
eukprot:scaffold258889_cov35-Tisochrysis_lutea.AAC.1